MNLILSPFGYELPAFSTLCANMTAINNWWEILRPDYLVAWLFYFAFAYGMLYICFILPFRLFKHLIKAPDKKGKVK